MTTQEELIASAINIWAKEFRPKNLLETEHNISVLQTSFAEHVARTKRLTVQDIKSIVESLGDMRTGGRLQYGEVAPQPAAPDPAEALKNLPHADVKEIAWLRTTDDLKKFNDRVAKDGMAYMSGFKCLRPEEGARFKFYSTLNERIAFIQQNGQALEAAVEAERARQEAANQKPGFVTIATKTAEDSRITAIRERIEREFKGYTRWAQKTRDRLNGILEDLLANPQKQIYVDRSTGGGGTAYKGLDAIEKIMEQKITNADSPFGM